MDKLISKIVALGIPGLVLLVAISATGLAGGAATVAALAVLGGPLGMFGGLVLLAIIILIADGITQYGFRKIFEGVVKGLQGKGISKKEILDKIEHYPISRNLKLRLKNLLK